MWRWLSLIFILSLASCGFHLRQQAKISALTHKKIYVTAAPSASNLITPISNVLSLHNGSLAKSPRTSDYQLILHGESLSQNLSSVSSNTQIRSYVLRDRVDFSVADAQGKILGDHFIVSTQRTLYIDANSILSSNYEQDQIEYELRHRTIIKVLTLMDHTISATKTKQNS